MKRWILCFVTALAIGLIGSATASAQGYGWMGGGYGHGGYGHGGYGGYDCDYGYGGGYSGLYSAGYGGYGGGLGYSGRGISVGIGFGRPAVWHDTSHLHYHPGGYVRHRGHFDYVPGHYDVHRSGHWHR